MLLLLRIRTWYVYLPETANPCQAQLESARDNGIPVVTFDSDVSSEDLVSAYCGTDNQKLGDIAAKRMAHYLSNHGTVAVFSPQEKTLSSKSRVEAFQEKYCRLSWYWSGTGDLF